MGAADLETRVRQLHRRGVGATNSGRPVVGAATLRRGLALLGWTAPDLPPGVLPELAGRLLLSLAWAESELGRRELSFTLLDQATELVAAQDRGVAVQQRGLMLIRAGDAVAALACLDAAVDLLDPLLHGAVLARTLMNRANVHLTAGRVRQGRQELIRSASAAQAAGLDLLSAKVVHNLGLSDLHLGDIPSALDLLAEAESRYLRVGPHFAPVARAARARALLSAGLVEPAAATLAEAIEAFRRQRLTQDLGEAELMRAQCALVTGDAGGAINWAAQAARTFSRRGNERWRAVAQLVGVRGRALQDPRSGYVRRHAPDLADRLRALGLAADAEIAALVAQRCAVARGERVDARAPEDAPRAGRWEFGYLEAVLLRHLTAAEAALADGDPGRALAHTRRGLARLHDRRGRLGSLDLRVGTAALGRELGALGLRTAVRGGRAAQVLEWSERSRAQAFAVQPVRAPADPDAADALAELRQLRHQLRTAQLAGQPGGRDATVLARCTELERLLRERQWRTAGAGITAGPVRPAELAAELGDRALVSFLHVDCELAAVLLVAGRTRLIGLGSGDGLAETVRRLLTDLDALAGRALPERLAAVVHASAQRHASALSDRLFGPLRELLGDRELVLVPTGEVAALPWALLPVLRGRPVSVAPSAAAWYSAATAPAAETGRVLLAAGPALEHVDHEFNEIAGLHPDPVDLRAERAGVVATLAALDGAHLAHLAAHGHHEPANVLFSRLDLADGPLLAYDIQRLASVPRLVTLSACDVGRSVVRPGDEQLGFTAALLYAGSRCVVSSVCRVSHETSAAVMVALHRALAEGAGPARALALASEKEPLATFVAFGAG